MFRRNIGFRENPRFEHRITQRLGPLGGRQLGDGQIRGPGHERMVGGETEHKPCRPAAHLREDLRAVAVALLDLGQDAMGLSRIREGFEQGEGGGAGRSGAQAADHFHLGFEGGMLAHHSERAGGDQLNDAGADLPERAGDGHKLGLWREGARHLIAVDRPVAHDAGGGEANRAGAQGFPDDQGDLAGLGLGRIGVAALRPQHIVADRPVSDHRGDAQGVFPARQIIEIFAIGLPGAPGHAFVERCAGNVLDTLHQLDQRTLAAWPHRGEAHAAIAHDDGADAVAGRGIHLLVPGDLAVIVGVNIDPGGGDDCPVGVDDLLGGLGDARADRDDHPVLHRDVAGGRLAAGAVEDRPAANDGVVHAEAPSQCARRRDPQAPLRQSSEVTEAGATIRIYAPREADDRGRRLRHWRCAQTTPAECSSAGSGSS